jgi:hypothetical protein
VGEVGVEGLAEGEVGWVVIDCVVYRTVGGGYVDVGEAGDEFLEVADSLGTAGGVAVAVVVVIWTKLVVRG